MCDIVVFILAYYKLTFCARFTKQGVITDSTLVVGMARLGQPTQQVGAESMRTHNFCVLSYQ